MASPSAILADQVWQALVIALNRGEGPSIRIPDAYKPLLGREGMDIIVARYRLADFISSLYFDS